MAATITFHGYNGENSRSVLPYQDPDSASKIPVLDCKDIFSPDLQKRQRVAQLVSQALQSSGVLYVINHGVPQELEGHLKDAARRFFDLPLDRKMKLHESKSQAKRGYQYLLEGRDDEPGRNDCREVFKLQMETALAPTTDPTVSPLNVWPDQDLPEFRLCVEAYASGVLRFAQHFRRILALSLDMPEDYFDDLTSGSAGLSLLYYPSAKQQAGEGRRIHTDYSLFTMINQLSDVPALEYLDHTGHFVLVRPLPGSMVVNIGDCLERASNKRYSSTVHRVINHADQERYSVVYFFDADPEREIRVASSCVSDQSPRRFEDVMAGLWQPGLYLK